MKVIPATSSSLLKSSFLEALNHRLDYGQVNHRDLRFLEFMRLDGPGRATSCQHEFDLLHLPQAPVK